MSKNRHNLQILLLLLCASSPLYGQGTTPPSEKPKHVFRKAPLWQWQGRIRKGQVVQVQIVRGHVVIQRTQGKQISIKAIRRAESDDPSSVALQATEDGSGVHIIDLYPPPIVGPPRECLPPYDAVRGDFWHSTVKTLVIVRVPREVRVVTQVLDDTKIIRDAYPHD